MNESKEVNKGVDALNEAHKEQQAQRERTMMQAKMVGSVTMSGQIGHYTPFDMARIFHAACLGKGRAKSGKISENTSSEILEKADDRFNNEAIGVSQLLAEMYNADGMVSLEKKAELLHRICATVFALYRLADNMGLPFDAAFMQICNNEMSKVMGIGLPMFDENDELILPSEYVVPNKAIFDICLKQHSWEVQKPTNLSEEDSARIGAARDKIAGEGKNNPAIPKVE